MKPMDENLRESDFQHNNDKRTRKGIFVGYKLKNGQMPNLVASLQISNLN